MVCDVRFESEFVVELVDHIHDIHLEKLLRGQICLFFLWLAIDEVQGVKTLRLESADGFELLFIKDLSQVDVAGQKTIDIGSVDMQQV